MIKVKLEKNKLNEPIFKLGIKDEYITKYSFIKRALIEGKNLKGTYNYKIPLRYFEPILNNIDNEEILIDKKSILFFLEFSDDYDEKYYYKTEADARFMKKWREEGCPNIYKISLDPITRKISKNIAFKRISPTPEVNLSNN